jgi:hypothetical protein
LWTFSKPGTILSEVETTENNMIMAGTPPRAGGASTGGLRPVLSPVTGLQEHGRGVE